MRFFTQVLCSLSIIIGSCQTAEKPEQQTNDIVASQDAKPDTYFQYSIWWAFVNKVFDGDLKISTMKTKGD